MKVDSGKIQDDNAASTTSGSGGVKSGKLVFGSKGFENTPKRIPDDLRDSLKKEENKGQKFQAFTGNKHVLWRDILSNFTPDLHLHNSTGCIVVPDWMMENSNIQEGELVEVASVVLPTGNYMKLQPHTTKFIELSNPKPVLGNNLSSFSCLSKGDTIMITHNDQKFYINILEMKPGPAICLIGMDCEADFAAPLDCKEPAKPEKVEEMEIEELLKFRPFVGKGRCLDREPVEMKVDSGKIQDDNAASTTSGSGGVKSGKLFFGSKGFKNTPKRIPDDLRDSLKKEENKGQKFQAFTGNKHVLWRE
ncbi:unnamed protein product [Fraxinus pennsylvanica]|uniref:Ubiquitin fusion degradation protein UFD1 N-terminal subdomain 2 domain-containing protein n=1 Tax=Fraxinus pennsylvanica TaxID=56036 RepID=A0AAD2DUH4_9LAMI|nr:unnamed protein product [Fraxinus pennsylvanica]